MIRKRIAAAIVILLAFLLQTTVFQPIKLADAVPNLLLAVTITYGYLRGRTSGLVIGFVCGLLLDCMYGSVIGLYAFIFLTIGFEYRRKNERCQTAVWKLSKSQMGRKYSVKILF